MIPEPVRDGGSRAGKVIIDTPSPVFLFNAGDFCACYRFVKDMMVPLATGPTSQQIMKGVCRIVAAWPVGGG